MPTEMDIRSLELNALIKNVVPSEQEGYWENKKYFLSFRWTRRVRPGGSKVWKLLNYGIKNRFRNEL